MFRNRSVNKAYACTNKLDLKKATGKPLIMLKCKELLMQMYTFLYTLYLCLNKMYVNSHIFKHCLQTYLV